MYKSIKSKIRVKKKEKKKRNNIGSEITDKTIYVKCLRENRITTQLTTLLQNYDSWTAFTLK